MKTVIIHRHEFNSAADLLRSGGLVAFPTETVYGLGADATNPQAVARIFEAKQRPEFDPLIVHVADLASASLAVTEFPKAARILANELWPGPLTLVLPKTSQIPDLVTSGLPGVGLRIPNHPIALELLKLANLPIAAPSANPFGRISPTTVEHVLQGLDGRIDMVVDGGPCSIGLESTVISFMEREPLVLRPGGCPIEVIENLIGTVRIAASDPSRDDQAQPAPGMLSRHYAPQLELQIVPRNTSARPKAGRKTGLLTYGNQPFSGRFDQVEVLSADDNLQTCAAKFFAALRCLDSERLDVIIAHEFPARGLGIALNDRLRRAACRG
ncbi:MAG: L-threonylcarbamoyladenylate synthase [Planctomycetota bacterium]